MSELVFRRVAKREITPELGAALIVQERERERVWPPTQPRWMPRWLYVLGIMLVSAAIAPLAVSLFGADYRRQS